MNNRAFHIRIIILSSFSIASIYIVMGIIRIREDQYINLVIDFIKIFAFSLTLWLINLLLYTCLRHSITEELIYVVIVIVSSVYAYYSILFFSNSLTIVSELQHVKTEGVGFRGIVANFLIVTFLYTTNILIQYKKIESENEKLKRNQLETQLSQLKAQLNPHFLFNSLNTLKAMVEDNDENSVEYLIKLSEVYRYLLDNSETHLAIIKEELTIANAYFFMLKNRFENSISLVINLNDEDYERKIPSMSLQLLIENAVKHNVISKGKPLKITISQKCDKLIVENNLQLKRSVEESTKIGLVNLNNRCKILLNKEIDILKTENTFTVNIPLV